MKQRIVFTLLLLPVLIFSQKIDFSGIGYQKNTNNYWDIALEKINDSNYRVYYPSLDCSGTWTLVENKKYKKFKEEITEDENKKCVPIVYVLLVNDAVSPNTKRFYIYENIKDKQPLANGFLNEFQDYQD